MRMAHLGQFELDHPGPAKWHGPRIESRACPEEITASRTFIHSFFVFLLCVFLPTACITTGTNPSTSSVSGSQAVRQDVPAISHRQLLEDECADLGRSVKKPKDTNEMRWYTGVATGKAKSEDAITDAHMNAMTLIAISLGVRVNIDYERERKQRMTEEGETYYDYINDALQVNAEGHIISGSSVSTQCVKIYLEPDGSLTYDAHLVMGYPQKRFDEAEARCKTTEEKLKIVNNFWTNYRPDLRDKRPVAFYDQHIARVDFVQIPSHELEQIRMFIDSFHEAQLFYYSGLKRYYLYSARHLEQIHMALEMLSTARQQPYIVYRDPDSDLVVRLTNSVRTLDYLELLGRFQQELGDFDATKETAWQSAEFFKIQTRKLDSIWREMRDRYYFEPPLNRWFVEQYIKRLYIELMAADVGDRRNSILQEISELGTKIDEKAHNDVIMDLPFLTQYYACRNAMRSADFSSALQVCNNACDASPNLAEPKYMLAAAQMHLEKFNDALQIARDGYSQFPDCYQFPLVLGLTFYMKSEHETGDAAKTDLQKSIIALSEAFSMAPHQPEIQAFLALTNAVVGNYKKSLEQYFESRCNELRWSGEDLGLGTRAQYLAYARTLGKMDSMNSETTRAYNFLKEHWLDLSAGNLGCDMTCIDVEQSAINNSAVMIRSFTLKEENVYDGSAIVRWSICSENELQSLYLTNENSGLKTTLDVNDPHSTTGSAVVRLGESCTVLRLTAIDNSGHIAERIWIGSDERLPIRGYE